MIGASPASSMLVLPNQLAVLQDVLTVALSFRHGSMILPQLAPLHVHAVLAHLLAHVRTLLLGCCPAGNV
jgi:hypothetical protein